MTHTNEHKRKGLMSWFSFTPKKSEELTVVPDTEISVAIPDIKQYLVEEYERVNELKLINEGLEQELEKSQEVKIKYDAALVTLDEYSRRLKSTELSIAKEKEKTENVKRELKAAIDEVNSYKIKLSHAALTKEELKEEIREDLKTEIISKINNHKGNLSKKIVCELINGITYTIKEGENNNEGNDIKGNSKGAWLRGKGNSRKVAQEI